VMEHQGSWDKSLAWSEFSYNNSYLENLKMAPRYIGPFPILEKCRSVAYKLQLSPSLVGVHDIFHISQLKKCLKAPVDVVLPDMTLLKADLTYPEHPVKILDKKDRVTRRRMIMLYKV
jgi:hypothetical protein